MSDFTKPTDRLAACIDSAWRWPDPFSAPDVPARPLLEAFAAGLITPVDDPDLALQIAQSVNCRRALDCVRGAALQEGSELAGLKRSLAPAPPPARAPQDAGTVVPGAVWATAPSVLVFDQERRAPFRWRLSAPPVALLLEGPLRTGNDTLWRGVLVTLAEDRPAQWLREDEVLVETVNALRWHVHLWLEFPISQEQLVVELARLDESNLENVQVGRAAFADGLPLPLNTQRGSPVPLFIPAWERTNRKREREQLLERAQWLAATADAHRLALESAPNDIAVLAWLIGIASLQSLRRAAGSLEASKLRELESVFCVPSVGVEIVFCLESDLQTVSLEVYSRHGRPSNLLDQASVLNAEGCPVGRIERNQARIPATSLSNGFRLKDPSGNELLLEPKGERLG